MSALGGNLTLRTACVAEYRVEALDLPGLVAFPADADLTAANRAPVFERSNAAVRLRRTRVRFNLQTLLLQITFQFTHGASCRKTRGQPILDNLASLRIALALNAAEQWRGGKA